MEKISFKLQTFEGPLDLLLHLIGKHKLNIEDIEISLLLEQYLDYINDLKEQDFEIAGEFLEMAAKLIYIKTVSLLPKPNEANELKKELEGRLIEYSLCKDTAEKLKIAYIGGEIFVREQQKIDFDKTYTKIHNPEILVDAFMGISLKKMPSEPLNEQLFRPIVSHKIVSVYSKTIYILKKLYSTGKCSMKNLYNGMVDRSERVATFLAVLELTKSGRITLSDDNNELYFSRNKKKKD